MELSELAAYAEEKFHIREQRKWAEFPGFSVLADPNTGKWAALLMRQWDFDTGTEIQRCDIKCGRQALSELSAPYLSMPFRMKGSKWVGVIFDSSTEPDVVFRLFDRAVYSGGQRGYTMVLDTPPRESAAVYPDAHSAGPMAVYPDTPLSGVRPRPAAPASKIPQKILKMLELDEYKGGSFAQKCRNFCRQAKFMEDYEDDVPWTGTYRRYFPTYHDLTIRQLRGYFTWRTRARKGDFSPIPSSLAYMYLYELLNGIGAGSPEDTLKKMRDFEEGFLDSGIGDPGMRGNLHRWMLEYAVLHQVSPELARQIAGPSLVKKDAALAVLKGPKGFSDEEVFSALCIFEGKKLGQSPVARKAQEKGRHLFAAVWRHASEARLPDGRDLFTACFGEPKTFPWHPLSNAVYWEERTHPDTDYILNECRAYHCRGGIWQEERYDSLYFDRDRFHGFLRESDRQLRKYLKTGHYLRGNPDEAWAAPYVEEAIETERRAELEAAKPKITINLSSLEQIRQDALRTRDSLLTEEDMDFAAGRGREQEKEEEKSPAAGGGLRPEKETGLSPGGSLGGEQGVDAKREEDMELPAGGACAALDAVHRQILLALLRGEPIQIYLKAGHLMPSVAADTINEALFDEIGDNVLECDGDTITVVEDYRDEVLQVLGGRNQ